MFSFNNMEIQILNFSIYEVSEPVFQELCRDPARRRDIAHFNTALDVSG